MMTAAGVPVSGKSFPLARRTPGTRAGDNAAAEGLVAGPRWGHQPASYLAQEEAMSPTTNRQHVGLVITGLLSLLNVTSVLMPTPDGE